MPSAHPDVSKTQPLTIRTEMLTYNVHDRGRKHRGQNRIFDTVALAKLINSPETQERVKHGDMLGYYGHWARVKFGMATQEVGFLDGQIVPLPTAIRTTHLSCDNDGNITHQAEFLNTAQGQIAAGLFNSQAGGFSSAIDAVPGSRPSIPLAFHGFDYVLEPNYSTNRGYARVLDSISDFEDPEELAAMLDAAIAEQEQTAKHLLGILDSMSHQHTQALEALEVVSRENDILIERLARVGGGGAILDSVDGGRMAPRMAPRVPHFERFRDMDLQPLQELKGPEVVDNSPEGVIVRRMGL